MGFGRAGRAGLGWAWDLALVGALGWVGRVYGLHCTCLLHVCMMSLCSSSCVSQICICVGRGFGCAGRAGGRGIWPCRAHWAGLGVRFGSGGRAGLGWACVWSTLYMSSSCLHHVFVFIFMCISDV